MARRPKSDQRTALRAGIVLDCASGLSNTAVAQRHEVTLAGDAGAFRSALARFAGPRDAAFAVSFSPYAADTIAQAQSFAERGAPIIAVTDSVFSPLAAFSACWFEVVESDFAGFRSLSASMALAMALPVAVAEKRRRLERERDGYLTTE